MMKKILIAICVSTLITSSAMAADTFTGAFFEAQQKKIDAQTSKVVNSERQLRDQQAAATQLRQKQQAERMQQIQARQKAQQDLIDQKRQKIQNTKDAFKQQKQDIKDIFTIN